MLYKGKGLDTEIFIYRVTLLRLLEAEKTVSSEGEYMNKDLNLNSKQGEDFIETVKGAFLDALLSEDTEAKADLLRKDSETQVEE